LRRRHGFDPGTRNFGREGRGREHYSDKCYCKKRGLRAGKLEGKKDAHQLHQEGDSAKHLDIGGSQQAYRRHTVQPGMAPNGQEKADGEAEGRTKVRKQQCIQ
jgi:hypothetical protein